MSLQPIIRTLSQSLFAILLSLPALAQQPAPSIPSTGFPGLDEYRASRISIYTDDFGQLARYREADAKPQSRFGYRFAVKNVGRPHLAVVRYPDDKRRFMSVTDGTCYDLSTGVFTGPGLPVSGGMLEIRQVFWPRWQDCSIVFTTLADGEPAAVTNVAIYELADLPPWPVLGDPGDGSRRELGIQYEDPCGSAASEGAMATKPP